MIIVCKRLRMAPGLVAACRCLQRRLLFRKKSPTVVPCRQGAVPVSPSISPSENAIMRAAFAEGFPEIILKDNGFAPLTKPAGQSFDACVYSGSPVARHMP